MIGDKRVPLNIDCEDKRRDSDGNIRTRYGRIIRNLSFNLFFVRRKMLQVH